MKYKRVGWVVTVHGGCAIDTVARTRRKAIAEYMCTRTSGLTASERSQHWRRFRERHGIKCVPVYIEEHHDH